MNKIFCNCSSLLAYPDISKWEFNKDLVDKSEIPFDYSSFSSQNGNQIDNSDKISKNNYNLSNIL